MKYKIQFVIESDDRSSQTTEDIFNFPEKLSNQEDIGISLTESKDILLKLQSCLVEEQVKEFIQLKSCCGECHRKLRSKGDHDVIYRTLFGNISLKSSRFYTCKSCHNSNRTFSPLSDIFPDHISPEMKYMETKWGSLMSFGMTVALLKDVLPIDNKLNPETVRKHLYEVSNRDELSLRKEEEVNWNGSQSDIKSLPLPEGPIVVGIDGGYVKDSTDKSNNFEVIVGKSMARDQNSKCFGFVQRYDDKPRRRLFDMLESQGLQMNQEVTFLSDGGATVQNLQKYMCPEAEHILDWFHITMRITVINQCLKSLVKIDEKSGSEVVKDIESMKWYLWHGNAKEAFEKLTDATYGAAEFKTTYTLYPKLEKYLNELWSYLDNNRSFLTDYGERYRNKERVSTGFVESTVNYVISKRFAKKQQMQWTDKGAHLLLQTRLHVINKDLDDVFRGWYPGFKIYENDLKDSA